MGTDASLIDRIYEASMAPQRWPDLLQTIAESVGARGAAIMMRSPALESAIASPGIADDLSDFIAQGWGGDTEFVAPLFKDQWPGFRTESDYRTAVEIAALPVHEQFLDPRGYIAGAATVIQGAGDYLIHIAVEGFASHAAAENARGYLDALRPHLARAISLTAAHADRSQIVVDSLRIAGVAAAVISGGGRLLAANDLFVERMRNRMIEGTRGLRFTDRLLADQLSMALARHRSSNGGVQSVAMRRNGDAGPFVIHLLPIIGAAREMCESDGVLLLIADSTNASVPSADLLRLLFDLTPMESAVARQLIEGGSISSAATALRIGEGTVKTHLKAIFAKTEVSRQSDLVRLLAGFAPPIVKVP